MRRGNLFAGLLLVNAVLVGALLVSRRPTATLGLEPAPAVAAVNEAVGTSGTGDPTGATPLAITNVTVVRTNTFSWQQLESEDYREYIARLRAIGCPELTIRDIVVADLKRNYAQRKAALRVDKGPFKYWITGKSSEPDAEEQRRLREETQALDLEMQRVATELLGTGWRELQPDYMLASDAQLQRQLAFLSPEKQQRVQGIRERYEGLESMVKRMSEQQKYDNYEELLGRYDAMKAELRTAMTPEEFEQYEMSTSWTAANIRNALVGFQPTEAEFRALFRPWRTQDEQLARIYSEGLPDPGKEWVHETIRQQLGEARYQEYRRSWWNRDYHALVRLQESSHLPDTTASYVYDLKEIAENQRQAVVNNASLTPEQRSAALQAIQAETRTTLVNTLGDSGFQSYTRGHGAWVTNLGRE